MWKFITVLIAAAIAIFLKSDGNVPLMFLPYPEKGAFCLLYYCDILWNYKGLLLHFPQYLFSMYIIYLDAFKGSVIWITGASSGIGASLALDLYKSGAQLILSARRKEQLEEVAAQCLKSTSSRLAPMVLPLDVTDLGAQKVAVNTVLETYGRIDMLVLNAGKSQRAVNYQFSYAQMQELMHLNFNSIVHLTQLVLPSMMLRQSGHVSILMCKQYISCL